MYWKPGEEHMHIFNPAKKRMSFLKACLATQTKFCYWWMENCIQIEVMQPNKMIHNLNLVNLKTTPIERHGAEAPSILEEQPHWGFPFRWKTHRQLCVLTGPGENTLAEESYPGPQGIHWHGECHLCSQTSGFTYQVRALVKDETLRAFSADIMSHLTLIWQCSLGHRPNPFSPASSFIVSLVTNLKENPVWK